MTTPHVKSLGMGERRWIRLARVSDVFQSAWSYTPVYLLVTAGTVFDGYI
jgi:hypothetical protein